MGSACCVAAAARPYGASSSNQGHSWSTRGSQPVWRMNRGFSPNRWERKWDELEGEFSSGRESSAECRVVVGSGRFLVGNGNSRETSPPGSFRAPCWLPLAEEAAIGDLIAAGKCWTRGKSVADLKSIIGLGTKDLSQKGRQRSLRRWKNVVLMYFRETRFPRIQASSRVDEILKLIKVEDLVVCSHCRLQFYIKAKYSNSRSSRIFPAKEVEITTESTPKDSRTVSQPRYGSDSSSSRRRLLTAEQGSQSLQSQGSYGRHPVNKSSSSLPSLPEVESDSSDRERERERFEWIGGGSMSADIMWDPNRADELWVERLAEALCPPQEEGRQAEVVAKREAERQKCGLCSRDLLCRLLPWGSSYNTNNDFPVVGVLFCGHAYHAECLDRATPTGSQALADPVCPNCEAAKSLGLKQRKLASLTPQTSVKRIAKDSDVVNTGSGRQASKQPFESESDGNRSSFLARTLFRNPSLFRRRKANNA